MIERAEIEYALIVDGESSRPITEATIERMLGPDIDEKQFRAEFASLTLGSGSAARSVDGGLVLWGAHPGWRPQRFYRVITPRQPDPD